MPIAKVARPPAPGLAVSRLPAGRPPVAPAKVVSVRTTSNSSCANRARRWLSATTNRTMRQASRHVSSGQVPLQPVDGDRDPLAIVFRVWPGTGALLALRDPSTGKHRLEESGGRRTSRFREPQLPAGGDDPVDQREQRLDVTTLIEDVGR